MTDCEKFKAVINRNKVKFWEVAAQLGMSPQSLYNKLGNATQFTQGEMAKFRTIFPDVTDAEFNAIFFASELTAEVK